MRFATWESAGRSPSLPVTLVIESPTLTVKDLNRFDIPDEKFGERVTAVASRVPGAELGEDDLRAFTRERLAHFKVPKRIHLVDQVQRAPNGKPDYKWAKQVVLDAEA